jgi:hypothetical protein
VTDGVVLLAVEMRAQDRAILASLGDQPRPRPVSKAVRPLDLPAACGDDDVRTAVREEFTHLHAHCAEWTSARFLAWVAEQGGPAHTTGLREELLAAVMATTLAKLKPGDLFSAGTDAGALIAAVARKEVGRVEKAGWYERFAYLLSDEAFFDMQERRHLPRGVFNALFRHIPCYSIHIDGKGKARRVEASICYDENRQRSEERRVGKECTSKCRSRWSPYH